MLKLKSHTKNGACAMILLTALMTWGNGLCQSVQGKAYYISKTTVDIDFRARQISGAQRERVEQRRNRLNTQNYVLEFNGPQSLFIEEEVLGEATATTTGRGRRGRGIRALLTSQNTGMYYKNLDTKELVAQREIFGKQFLIRDTLQHIEWQLGDEVKTIGKYTCFKATAKIPATNSAARDTMKTQTVTAWYTIEIPVSHGPESFWGLPGLILELKTNERILLCSKLELGAAGEMQINPPKKGKKIDQTEFDELLAKKIEEAEEMMGNRRGRGNRN